MFWFNNTDIKNSFKGIKIYDKNFFSFGTSTDTCDEMSDTNEGYEFNFYYIINHTKEETVCDSF